MNPSNEPAPRDVTIGGRTVGPSQPPFVIAEAGVNHNGDIETALLLVDAAADAGADAVKFQVFRAATLATESAPTADYQRSRTKHVAQRTMLAKLELPHDGLAQIASRCADRRITFMGTPFSPGDVADLVDAGTSAIKIASTDIVDSALHTCAIRTRLPVIVSTGAAVEHEIAAMIDRFAAAAALDRLVLLHCVSAYPTPLSSANLSRIRSLRSRFNLNVGHSDHTMSTLTGGWAVALGACVLEKHLTLDKSAHGPDHAMSLEPDELKEYITVARQAAIARGTGQIDHQPIESETRRISRKSVVTTRRIERGARIEAGMLSARRAGAGVSADAIESLIGRRAAVVVPADTPLEWEMVE